LSIVFFFPDPSLIPGSLYAPGFFSPGNTYQKTFSMDFVAQIPHGGFEMCPTPPFLAFFSKFLDLEPFFHALLLIP